MRSTGTASIRVAVLTAALAARALAGESDTLRAADAGLSPGFCPALRALVDAAGSGFTAFRGTPRVGGENMWQGTKRLPGGGDGATPLVAGRSGGAPGRGLALVERPPRRGGSRGSRRWQRHGARGAKVTGAH